METAQNSSRRSRMIVLYEAEVESLILKISQIPAFEKKPSIVLENSRHDLDDFGKSRWLESKFLAHRSSCKTRIK